MNEPTRTMARLHLLLTLLIELTIFLCSVSGAPGIALPVNAQVPPVARVGKQFEFVFSESTFSPGQGQLSYDMQNAPRWLQLDGAARTLRGTPGDEDTGSQVFDLVAVDDTPGSASMAVTLVVSNQPGPAIGNPVTEQLESMGTVSGPDTILLYPSSEISLSFDSDTFSNIDEDTSYYATCANNTPLPSWINFHPEDLSFTGRTPEENSPFQVPQEFGIRLMASDTPGFSSAATTFRLIIARHELTFGEGNFTITAIPGKNVSFDGLSSLTLDGHPASADEVLVAAEDIPSWLSLDERTFFLSGTVPKNVEETNFIVTARDIHSDTANTTVEITIAAGPSADIILNSIGPFRAQIGEFFEYQISMNSFVEEDVEVSIDLRNCSSWLSFDPTTLIISGWVPEDWVTEEEKIHLTATLGTEAQTQEVTIDIYSPAHTTGTRGPSATATDNTAAPDTPLNGGGGNSRERKVLAAVLVPVFLLAAALLVAYCLRRRRRRLGKPPLHKQLEGPWNNCIEKLKREKPWISYPTLQEDKSEIWHDNEKLIDPTQRQGPPIPVIPERPRRVRPAVAKSRQQVPTDVPQLPSHVRRSSWREGLMNEIRSRSSRNSLAARICKMESPKLPQEPQFSIAEEKPSPKSPRRSGGGSSTRGATTSAIEEARALRQKRIAMRRSRALASSRRASGLGHGLISTSPTRNPAMTLARSSLPQCGLGHGRGWPPRNSTNTPITVQAGPSWTTISPPSTSISHDTSGGSWLTESSNDPILLSDNQVIPYSPGIPSLHHRPHYIGHRATPTIRHVIPSRTPTGQSIRPAAAAADPATPRPSRDKQLSLNRRERQRGSSGLFGSSVATPRRSSSQPLPPRSLSLSRHGGGFGGGGGGGCGTDPPSLDSVAERLLEQIKEVGIDPLTPVESNAAVRSKRASRRKSGLARGGNSRVSAAATAAAAAGPSSSSLSASSQPMRQLEFGSSPPRYQPGYGAPPQLAQFSSVSAMERDSAGSEGTGPSIDIDLIVESPGEETRGRMWKEGVRASRSSEVLRSEEERRAVLRDGMAQRPVSVTDEGQEPRALESLSGDIGKAFI